MPRMIIVVGDITTGGGRVVSGSPETDIDGKPVSRLSDKATCPLHKGVFPIVSGDMTFIIDGQPVARQGDYLACGCSLISVRQFHVFLDEGTSDNPAVDQAMAKSAFQSAAAAVSAKHASLFDLTFLIKDESTGRPLPGSQYRITLESGKVFEGVADHEGMTQAAHSDLPELATIEVDPYAEEPAESSAATTCTDTCGC